MENNGIRIKGIVTGLLVVIAGVLLYLFNTGSLPIEYKSIVFSWQMLLVALGINGLFSRHGWGGGIALILIGGFFLLKKMNIESLSFISQNGWTILLILVGLVIIIHAVFGKCCCGKCRKDGSEFHRKHFYKRKGNKNETGYVDMNYVFSGTVEKVDIDIFRGGDINCVFGGVELDLSDCRLAEEVNVLEINTVFGGTVIYAPEDWHIEIRQNQVFGNFVDHRPKNNDEIDRSKILIIEASSVFAGGEIKCKGQ